MRAPFIAPDDYPQRIVRLERQIQCLKFAVRGLVGIAFYLTGINPAHAEARKTLGDILVSLDSVNPPT